MPILTVSLHSGQALLLSKLKQEIPCDHIRQTSAVFLEWFTHLLLRKTFVLLIPFLANTFEAWRAFQWNSAHQASIPLRIKRLLDWGIVLLSRRFETFSPPTIVTNRSIWKSRLVVSLVEYKASSGLYNIASRRETGTRPSDGNEMNVNSCWLRLRQSAIAGQCPDVCQRSNGRYI